MPPPALPCQHIALGVFSSDGAQREMPSRTNIGDHRSKVSRMLIGIRPDGLTQGSTALACAPERIRTVGAARFHPARLGHRERLFGAPGNGLAFGWGDECHDADAKIAGFRQTDGKKPRAAIAQCHKEGRVLSWAVQSAHSRRLSLSVQSKYLADIATHIYQIWILQAPLAELRIRRYPSGVDLWHDNASKQVDFRPKANEIWLPFSPQLTQETRRAVMLVSLDSDAQCFVA